MEAIENQQAGQVWGAAVSRAGFNVGSPSGIALVVKGMVLITDAVLLSSLLRMPAQGCLRAVCKLHLYCSEYEDAQNVLKDAIRLGLESNTMPQVYEATVELADCLLQLGDRHKAARLAMSLLEKEQMLERVRRKAEQVTADALGRDSALYKNKTT